MGPVAKDRVSERLLLTDRDGGELHALGGIAATPVINRPGIGPNRIVERPVVDGSFVTVRKMMNLSSSFDHRIVDGFDAASFVQRVKRLIEHPALIFMDQA